MKRSLDAAVLIGLVAAFLLLNLLLATQAAQVARRTEIVPVPSTYRTTASGCRALFELLDRLGHRVGRLETRLSSLPPDVDVLVMMEPEIYLGALETQHLREWVDQGGTLILASAGIDRTDSPIRELPATLFLRDPGVAAARLAAIARGGQAWPTMRDGQLWWEPRRDLVGRRYLAGVEELALDPARSAVPRPERLHRAAAELTDQRREVALVGDDLAPLVSLTRIGAGQVIVCAAPALFANGQLLLADNAVFGANLLTAHAAGGRILFDEYHLGLASTQSPWELLWRRPARYLTLQLGLALAVWLVWVVTRFGPARLEPEASVRRPAVAFVEAIAGLHQRAGANRLAAIRWRHQARRRLAQAAGASPAIGDERLAERLASRGGVDATAVVACLTALDQAAESGVSDDELLRICVLTDELLRLAERHGQQVRGGDDGVGGPGDGAAPV